MLAVLPLCSDHSQGLALVKPLSLAEVTRHINKFLCKAAQKRVRLMQINDLLRMELRAECLGRCLAFLMHESSRSPSISNLPQQHFLCFQGFWCRFGGKLQYMELIRTEQVSNVIN